MDLNRVRAGAVSHPSEWKESGYREIQQLRPRYPLIDHRCLIDLLRIPSMDILQSSHRGWVEEYLRIERLSRDSRWSESIAVGYKGFVPMVPAVPSLVTTGNGSVFRFRSRFQPVFRVPSSLRVSAKTPSAESAHAKVRLLQVPQVAGLESSSV
jgi:hypothetical protein